MPDPYNYLGEILTHYSKYFDIARARELFDRALELDPSYKVVLFHLTTFQLALGDVEDARAILERYRDDHDPTVARLRVALSFHTRRYADVVALEQDPRIGGTLLENEQFMSSLLRTGNAERALELSTWHVERNLEENLGYQVGLAYWYDGMLSFEAGELRRALQSFSAAPPYFESPVVESMGAMVTAHHAQALEAVGELEAAIEVARRGREVDHFDPTSRFEAARLLFAAGRIEAGDREIAGLEALARENPSPYYDCWLTLARSAKLRAAGDPLAALNEARSVPEACDPFVRQSRAMLLARAAEDAGDLEQALRHFGDVANPPWAPMDTAFETTIPALYHVARLEQRAGKLDEARRHYREFLDHWGDVDMPVPMVEEAKRALAALGG
jgi:tetratricopeptide (TPR) repeat protein